MFKKVLAGAGILIGMYVVLTNYTGFSTDIKAGSDGASSVAKTLQGR